MKIMKKLTLLFVGSSLTLYLAILWLMGDGERSSATSLRLAYTSPTSCVSVGPSNNTYQDAAILDSGYFCIKNDFTQRKLYGAGHSGPSYGHALIEVFGGDVVIDLQGHILHSDFRSHGVLATTASNRGWAERERRTFGLTTTRITIKNGVIDLRGTGTGTMLINHWALRDLDDNVPPELHSFERTSFILENLRITTDNIGIILEGAGNIVRNCIIESGGSAAIMMAGPNGQITDNTIILRSPLIPGALKSQITGPFDLFDLPEILHERRLPKSAIVLHLATGAKITGNRIEVKEASATRHAIYLTDASKEVVIGGNTFVGSEDPVTLLKGSTAILKNNVLEPRKPWWKF